MLEPEAFLIEPATRYRDALGYRDRVLVLIRNGTLKVSAELVVGATIRLEGEARTLLGARITAEVPWPERLTRRAVKRLDVRAAVLATSVQTPEGVDLAERAAASPIGDSGGE